MCIYSPHHVLLPGCRLHLGRRCVQSGHDCQEPSCSCRLRCGYTTGCSEGLGTNDLYKFSSSEEPSCFSPHCLLYSTHSVFLLLLILTEHHCSCWDVSLSAAEEEVCWLSVTQRTAATSCSSGHVHTHPQ